MDEKKNAPVSNRPTKGRELICENLSFAAKEAFKRLRTNLVMSFPEDDPSCKLIGITSAQPSDGKSTVAISLAYSLAELDKKVLLVDADLRRRLDAYLASAVPPTATPAASARDNTIFFQVRILPISFLLLI